MRRKSRRRDQGRSFRFHVRIIPNRLVFHLNFIYVHILLILFSLLMSFVFKRTLFVPFIGVPSGCYIRRYVAWSEHSNNMAKSHLETNKFYNDTSRSCTFEFAYFDGRPSTFTYNNDPLIPPI